MTRVLMFAVALAMTGAGVSWSASAADPATPSPANPYQPSAVAPKSDQPAPATPENAADSGADEQARLERAFSEMLTGATLCGRFTAGDLSAAPCKDKERPGDGDKPQGYQSGDKPAKDAKGAGALKEDRYTLGQVKKLQGDLWLIEARIQYGEHDVTVPLALKVKWAGDTPVITLTDFTVPGMGTFTARVLFYRGQYAGTWRHGEHGGEMFGKILPAAK